MTIRTYYSTSSTGLSTTTSTTYVDKVALTFTPEASSTYAIFWSAVMSGSSITNFNNVRLQKTTGTALTLQEFKVDRDELLEENAHIGLAIYTSSVSPSQESFAVQFSTSVGTDTIYLSDTHITALKLSTLAGDTYQTNLSVTSSNTNTYSSVNSITVDPGDWYIIGAATVNVNTTTMGSRGLTGVRIQNASTTSGSMEHDSWYPEAAGNFTPYFGIITASVLSPTTFNLQLKDNSAGSSSLQERTLLALRDDAFATTPSYGVSEAETTASNSNVDKLTLVTDFDKYYHSLVISSWVTHPPNEISTQAFSNLTKNGTSVFTYSGEGLREGQTIYDLFQHGYTSKQIITDAATTWRVRHRSTSATFTSSMKNAAVLVLPLEEALPTKRIRYVNTDSTPGGDGTTNNTTGGTRAYASLSSSLVAEKIAQSNLTTNDEILEIRCSGTTIPDTGSVEILSWTTSPRNYILITTESSTQKATSPWSTSRYRLSVNTGPTITSYESVTIDGLQLENTSGSATNVIRLFDANSNEAIVIKNCYLKSDNATAINAAIAGGSSLYVINNLISGSSLSNYGIFIAGDIAVLPNTKYYVYNNTFVGFEFEHIYLTLNEVGDTASIKNNLFYRGYSTAERTFRTINTSGSQIYETNASSDNWAPANTSDAGTLRNRTFTFENESLGNYKLSEFDVGAKDVGTDLSADIYYSFTTDFDLTVRPIGGSWDVGAFEGPPTPTTTTTAPPPPFRPSGSFVTITQISTVGKPVNIIQSSEIGKFAVITN